METIKKSQGEKTEKSSFSLEILKALSLLLSSIIIALTGSLLTYRYNSNQLDISRNKELFELVPKLYSPYDSVKSQGVVGLALYGENAVLPLISLWGNKGDDVPLNLEILNSIVIIGDVAVPYLLKVVESPYEKSRKRSYSIYALSILKYKDCKKLVKEALYNIDSDAEYLKGAIMAAGYLKYTEMTPKLIQISKKFHNDPDNVFILTNVARALSKLGGRPALEEVKTLLENPDVDVRIEAINAMIVLGSRADIPALLKITADDWNLEVRKQASFAIKAIEINKGL